MVVTAVPALFLTSTSPEVSEVGIDPAGVILPLSRYVVIPTPTVAINSSAPVDRP